MCKGAGTALGSTCSLPPLPLGLPACPVNVGKWLWDSGRDWELPLSRASACLFRPPSGGCPVAGGLPLSLLSGCFRQLPDTSGKLRLNVTPEITRPVLCRGWGWELRSKTELGKLQRTVRVCQALPLGNKLTHHATQRAARTGEKALASSGQFGFHQNTFSESAVRFLCEAP